MQKVADACCAIFLKLVLIFEKATFKTMQALVPAAPVLHSAYNDSTISNSAVSTGAISASALSRSRICVNLRVFGAIFLWQNMRLLLFKSHQIKKWC